MLYKLHYFFESAGFNALGLLLGVYMAEYTDATPTEIGLLFMLMPFINMFFRPIICSLADRKQSHRQYMILGELIIALSFLPFVIIPYLGPNAYKAHPRLCWYLLVVFKIIGDIAIGGAGSMADSLTINYAKRIGTDFSTYRVWATVSWMLFGFITGHLNEIWFLPKYVAAFMVLILVSLLDALVCFLWPKEYFVMITPSAMKKEREQQSIQDPINSKMSSSSAQTRSLMPKELVWAHAKKQLRWLVTFKWCQFELKNESNQCTVENANEITKDVGCPTTNSFDKSTDKSISKRAQLQTLALLIRRDPRIVAYLFVFVMAGALDIPVNFFIMSLSDRCHTQHTCDFSTLTGYLQISMASIESLIFLHITTISKLIGRLNTLTLASACALVKFLFYATIWSNVNPHWSLVAEMATGVIYGTFLAVQVDMGHLFSTEVEHLIPELIERGVIDAQDETSREKLKLSLAATMQALFGSASEGLGRGLGALVFGLIIDSYSYETLWLIIAIGSLGIVIALQLALMFEHCLHLNFGLIQLVDSKQQQTNSADLELQRREAELANGEH